MDSQKETINQPDLDKQVEIAILQREIEKLEDGIKKSFTWKTFLIATLFGAFIAGFLSYITVQEDNEWQRNSRIADYLNATKDKFPVLIVQSYRMEKGIADPYSEIELLTNDTTGLSRYSDKEIENVTKEIDKNILLIEKNLKSENRKFILLWTGIGILGANIYWILLMTWSNFIGKSKITKKKLELNEIGAQELKQNLNSEDEKDFFTQLVQINFKYLDQYYLQTQEQADKSFWISAIASMVGFLMIIAGIILMYSGAKTDPGYVATSAGVISEFIAAVFFYLYNKTILQMSQYHQKLVITQNISLALKTADLLKDSKERVLETLIDRLTLDVNKYLANSGTADKA